MKDIGMIPEALDTPAGTAASRLSETYAIRNFGTVAAWELLWILNSSPEKTALKMRVAAWAKKYRIAYRPVFLDDLQAEINALQKTGALENVYGHWVRPENNFVLPEVYNVLITHKIIPIADPHDLITHLTLLGDARYVQAHDRYSELWNEAYRWSRPFENKWSIDRIKTMRFWLDYGPARLGSLENFSYIIDLNGKKVLFSQGNAIDNGLIELLRGRPSYLVEYLLSWTYQSRNIVDDLDAEAFVRETGNQVLLERMVVACRNVGHYIGIGEDFTKPLRAKMMKRMRETLRARGVVSSGPVAPDDAKAVVDDLAEFIAEDPELSKIFSYESRIGVLETHNEFFEKYLAWLKTKYEKR